MDLLMIVILTRYYLTTTPKENIEIKLTDEEIKLTDIKNQLTDEEIKQTKQTKQIKQINQIDDNKHMYYEVNNLAQNSVIYNYLIIQ